MIWPYALGFVSARMYTDLPALSCGTCTWHDLRHMRSFMHVMDACKQRGSGMAL